MNPVLALLLACAGTQAFASLSEDAERVRQGYTVFCAIGPVETPVGRDMADFLLDRPDLAAFLAKRRRIAPYTIASDGKRQWKADDSDGTQGVVTLLESDGPHRLYYAQGVHRSSVFPLIRADVLVVMDLEPVQKEGCPARVSSRYEVYVRLRNPMLAGLVKLLRPFLQGAIERKFSRALLAAREVSGLLAREPAQGLALAREFPALGGADLKRFETLMSRLPAQPAGCL